MASRGRQGSADGDRGDIEEELSRSLVASRLFGDVSNVQLGRLQLVRYLGHGAVGVVYEAVDPERGSVAVKVLAQADPRGVYRVKREFRSLADLQHPNLVSLHELVHERGQWFFSMELVQGVPFDRWARSPHGGVDEHKLRGGLRQLASALSAIHAAGKLHCDLKPSNVLVTRDGVVKVLDFGLVSDHAGDRTASDTGLAGTPEYIAPEQAAGLPACPASDWYAIGVMIYGVLRGRLPFEGDPYRVLSAKQNHEAPKLELPTGAAPALHALCERLLMRDPRQRAGADDVLAALSYGEPSPAQTTSPSLPPPATFVGREAELAMLRAELRAAGSGTPALVLVGGPSGIGKSALLDRFAAELDSDVLLLRGRCYEQESLPYKVFDAVIDALIRHLRTRTPEQAQLLAPRHIAALTRLFPVLGRVEALQELGARETGDDPESVRARAFAAAKELLLRLTDHNRVVVMIDDLQWGDLDSARMMAHVFGPPEAPPLLFVGAYRGEEAQGSAFVSALLDERVSGSQLPMRRLSVEPLPASAATRLAAELLNGGGSAPDATDVERIAAAVASEAAGVPFFIAELAERARVRRAMREPHTEIASLEQAVVERVQALPPPCRELLDVLVVASQPIEAKVALSAASLPASERGHLRALRAARLVRGHGGASSEQVEVYHDRIRLTLSARIAPERVRSLHARIAAAMEEHGVRDPDRLVGFYIGAEDRTRATHAALSAAHAASGKLAFNRAAELYGRALELLQPDDPQRRELRILLADALANAGRGARASEQYLLAAQESEPGVARDLHLKAAQQCLRSGLIKRGIELAEPLLNRHGVSLRGGRTLLIARLALERLRGALPQLRPDASTELKDNAAERLATLGGLFQELMIVDPLRGSILHTAFMRHAMRQSDPVPQLKALVWASIEASLKGDEKNDRRADDLFRSIVELRRRIGTPYAHAMEHLAATKLHQAAARFTLGLEHGHKARQLFEECPGAYWERAHSAQMQLACIEFVGDLREITANAPELVRGATEREDEGALMLYGFCLALARLAHDEPEPMLAFLEKRLSLMGEDFSFVHYLAIHRIADCHLYLGRAEEGLRIVQQSWSRIVAMDYYRSTFIKAIVHSLRARMALSAFAKTRARALIPLVRADLKRLDGWQRGFGGMSLALRGTLEALLGDRAGAVHYLERGVTQLESEGIVRFLHCAERRLGEVLGGERGAELIELADAALRRQDVRRPERFTALISADMVPASVLQP